MKYTQTSISGLWLIEPKILEDERGYFFESYRQGDFARYIGSILFVQENESRSHRGVLRGLHLQRGEYAQSKLVRCVEGAVLDVAVDLREGSPTFGLYYSVVLSSQNHRQLFIPRGFAHGFLTLSSFATLQYKVDNVYNASSECSIRYDDPALNINWSAEGWEINDFVLSPKDAHAISLETYMKENIENN